MVWDLCSMDSSNITKEFSEKRKRKIPLGTKGRTSILSVESSASCGASFPVSRRKLPDRECFDTSFRQGSYHDWKTEQNPVRRMAKRLLSGEPLTDGRPLSDLIELDEHTRKCLAFEATLTDRQIDMLQELGYPRSDDSEA